jgi:hypothetical protein
MFKLSLMNIDRLLYIILMSLVDLGSEQTHKHIHKKELCSFLNPEKAAIFLKEALQDTNDSMIVGEIS